jgi:nucleoside-diphosphate-sugar epimerase
MIYLVTGGAGFIGSNLVGRLIEQGQTVRILDNFSTGKRENLEEYAQSVALVEGDVREYATVRRASDGVNVILHQAALPSVPRSIKDPLSSDAVNVVGTLNVLQAARDAGVKRVVFASSSSVYGDTPELPKHERMTPNPLSPYAVSKLAAEQYCRVFARVYGIETVSLRYFNVFGPRQDPDSEYAAVIPKFIRAMLRDKQPTIFGDGEQSRDFTFVENVIDGNLLAATAACEPGIVMNCACHGRFTLNKLVQAINEILGKEIHPLYAPARPGDVKHSFASIDLAQRSIGYSPSVEFMEGLRRTIEWYRARTKV